MGKYLEQTVWAGCLAGCGDGWTGGYGWAGHGRTLGCWCTLGGPGTCPDFHCAPGSCWPPGHPASCPRSGSGYPVSTHAATINKEEAETGQASGQQWLEVPRLLLALSAAVLQGTDRGVAADLVTADTCCSCCRTPGPSWS